MGQLRRTTRPDIWAHSSWALLQERSLPMGAAIGGRLTVTGAITIHTLRRIVALIGVTVTTMELLTMTTTRELMAGKRVRMARMARRQPGRDTILPPRLPRDVLRL